MKARHLILLPALALLSACAQDLYDGIETENVKVSKTPVYLTVYPETYLFSSFGESTTGSINSGSPWTMSGIDSSWLTVSPTSGNGGYDVSTEQFARNEVTYTAAENTEPVTRTNLITVTVTPEVTSNGETSTYSLQQYQTFTQYGITPVFTLIDGAYDTTKPAKGSTYIYDYSTNVPVNYLSVRCETEGCSGTFANGRLEVVLSDNPSAYSRYVYYYIYSQDTQVASFYFYQTGYSSSSSSSYVSIPGPGGSASIDFVATLDWTVTLPENSWVSVSPMSGSANEEVKVTVSAEGNTTGSTRSCDVKFTSTGNTNVGTLNVSQEAYTTSGSVNGFTNLPARGATRKMSLISPDDWTAQADCDWITVEPATGYANVNTDITITAAGNSASADTRYGNIYFYNNSSSAPIWHVTLAQKGAQIRFFSLNGQSLQLPADGSKSMTFTVDADAPWQVITNPDWVEVSPANGSIGETSVTIKATGENPSLVERTGTFTVGVPGTNIMASTTITQLGKEITPGQTEINVDWHEQASVPLTIEVPGDWTAASSVNWASVSPTSGTGTAQISVSIEANPSNNSRRGTVQVVSEGKAFNIPINQGGRYLIIDNQSGEIPATGGSVEFSVDATVDYVTSIEYGESLQTDWLTLTDNSSDGISRYLITATANNSINDREASVVLSSNDVNNVIYRVKQFGRSIRLNTTSLSISGNGGTTADVVVDADGTYTVSTDDTWFSIIEGSNNNFHLAVTPNDSGSTRYGTVTVTLNDTPTDETYSVTVTITQNNSRIDFDLDGFGSDQNWN